MRGRADNNGGGKRCLLVDQAQTSLYCSTRSYLANLLMSFSKLNKVVLLKVYTSALASADVVYFSLYLIQWHIVYVLMMLLYPETMGYIADINNCCRYQVRNDHQTY